MLDNVTQTSAARDLYTKNFMSLIIPPIMQHMLNLYSQSRQLSHQRRQYSVLRQFQESLRHVHEWNKAHLEQEVMSYLEKKSITSSQLEDLLTTVLIAHAEILSSINLTLSQERVNIKVDSFKHFLHTCYVELARKLYKNLHLFADKGTAIEKQGDMRSFEKLTTDSIFEAIGKSLPVHEIIRKYVTTGDNEEPPLVKTPEDEDSFFDAVAIQSSPNYQPPQNQLTKSSDDQGNNSNEYESEDHDQDFVHLPSEAKIESTSINLNDSGSIASANSDANSSKENHENRDFHELSLDSNKQAVVPFKIHAPSGSLNEDTHGGSSKSDQHDSSDDGPQPNRIIEDKHESAQSTKNGRSDDDQIFHSHTDKDEIEIELDDNGEDFDDNFTVTTLSNALNELDSQPTANVANVVHLGDNPPISQIDDSAAITMDRTPVPLSVSESPVQKKDYNDSVIEVDDTQAPLKQEINKELTEHESQRHPLSQELPQNSENDDLGSTKNEYDEHPGSKFEGFPRTSENDYREKTENESEESQGSEDIDCKEPENESDTPQQSEPEACSSKSENQEKTGNESDDPSDSKESPQNSNNDDRDGMEQDFDRHQQTPSQKSPLLIDYAYEDEIDSVPLQLDNKTNGDLANLNGEDDNALPENEVESDFTDSEMDGITFTDDDLNSDQDEVLEYLNDINTRRGKFNQPYPERTVRSIGGMSNDKLSQPKSKSNLELFIGDLGSQRVLPGVRSKADLSYTLEQPLKELSYNDMFPNQKYYRSSPPKTRSRKSPKPKREKAFADYSNPIVSPDPSINDLHLGSKKKPNRNLKDTQGIDVSRTQQEDSPDILEAAKIVEPVIDKSEDDQNPVPKIYTPHMQREIDSPNRTKQTRNRSKRRSRSRRKSKKRRSRASDPKKLFNRSVTLPRERDGTAYEQQPSSQSDKQEEDTGLQELQEDQKRNKSPDVNAKVVALFDDAKSDDDDD